MHVRSLFLHGNQLHEEFRGLRPWVVYHHSASCIKRGLYALSGVNGVLPLR